MASLPVDNLKSKAFKSYGRQQKLKQVMRGFNIFVALFLFCRSSLVAILIEFCCRLYRETTSLFRNSIYVFIIGNVMIVIIYILTLQDYDRTTVSDNVYHQYFCLNNNVASIDDQVDSEVEPQEPSEKQIVLSYFPSEKQGGSFSDKCLKEDSTVETETPKVGLAESRDVKEKFTEITETTMTTLRTVTSKADGENASKVKRNYKRVQTESHERSGGVLQRMTTKSRSRSQSQLVRYCHDPCSENQRRLLCVEDMSNEDFNRTIEDFIAEQKKQQREDESSRKLHIWHSHS